MSPNLLQPLLRFPPTELSEEPPATRQHITDDTGGHRDYDTIVAAVGCVQEILFYRSTEMNHFLCQVVILQSYSHLEKTRAYLQRLTYLVKMLQL